MLPSHGGAFRGHRERIRETAEHHDLRCEQIIDFVSKTPLTAYALVERMWPRGLSPFHQHFAVFEILAHLEYMQRRGRVLAHGNGGPLAWSPRQ